MHNQTEQCLFVYMTMPDKDTATECTRVLVRERLLACANILPHMLSVYWWDDKVQEKAEVVVVGKTTNQLYPLLEQRIKEIHPYEVPCLVAIKIDKGLPAYLHWLRSETKPPHKE